LLGKMRGHLIHPLLALMHRPAIQQGSGAEMDAELARNGALKGPGQGEE
jgi:hypothetical protein